MDALQSIMDKIKAGGTLLSQEENDEIKAIADNIVGFLDKNPEIDKNSFMIGFTVANMNALMEIMKTTTEEPQYNDEFIPAELTGDNGRI